MALPEVFCINAVSSAHLGGKAAGVSFCAPVPVVCLCSSQKKVRTGYVLPAVPWSFPPMELEWTWGSYPISSIAMTVLPSLETEQLC